MASLGARQRKQLLQQLDREHKAKARREGRDRLRTLRQHIRNAKKLRTTRLREVRGLCRRARKQGRERAKEIRRQHREAARQQVEAERRAELQACESRKLQAVAHAVNATERAAARLQAEQELQRARSRWARKEGTALRAKARELRAESDDEVAGNIPPELEPVWRARSHKFKASPHKTRTEAFTEWAAEHPGDVRLILDAELEESIADLIRAESRQRRELEGYGSRRRRAA